MTDKWYVTHPSDNMYAKLATIQDLPDIQNFDLYSDSFIDKVLNSIPVIVYRDKTDNCIVALKG